MGAAPSKPASTAPQPSRESLDEKASAHFAAKLSLSDSGVRAPLSSTGALTLNHIDSWEEYNASDPKLQLSRTVLAQTNIREALTSRQAKIADQHVFNTEIDFKAGPITNQKSSGRCWIFATTNVLRYNIMKKLNLKEFQLSQNYLFFWDKLNKSNYYLELSLENAELPLEDRLINHLAGDLISDGGQWDMVVNLLENYGVVPQAIMPESLHSSLSGPINSLIKTKLREHALVLRKLSSSLRASSSLSSEEVTATLRAKKEELLREVYTIMSATLGVPPKPDAPFTWDYYDANAKPHTWTGTPKEFYAAFVDKKADPKDCFSLINDPRNDYGKLYTVEKLGNVWGGRPVLYVNTEVDNLKAAVVKMIKAGLPVFFGSDVGQSSESVHGIMDTKLMEYENAFNITLGLTKAERLRVNESAMTHAMVITAVHLDESGKPVRYKVENSWGTDRGDKGWFVMTDSWFEQFVYQVVVPKSIAPKELVKVFEGEERVVLPPWDPMGSLA